MKVSTTIILLAIVALSILATYTLPTTSSMMAGGKHGQTAPSEKARELAAHHRAEIEAKHGATGTFEPVAMRTQVVAGANYYIKIKTGENQFVHAKIWHKLDNTSQLTDSSTGHQEGEEL